MRRRSATRPCWAEGEGTWWGGGSVSVTLRVLRPPSTWFEEKIVYEIGQMMRQACAYARTTEIETENRESLRISALETYHEAYFNEVEAGLLIGR